MGAAAGWPYPLSVPLLRPLTEADLDELLEMQRDGAVAGLSHLFPQETHPFPTEEIRQRWLGELADPTADCFVAEVEGRLAAFGVTQGDEFLHFGTAVWSWGTGLADRVHSELLAHMASQGHRRVWLKVFDENERAVRFYSRRGWVPTEDTMRTEFPPHPVLRRFERDL